jgi:hypothetical protein
MKERYLKNTLHAIEVVQLVRNDPTTAAAMYHGRGLSNFKLMQVTVTKSTVTHSVCTKIHTAMRGVATSAATADYVMQRAHIRNAKSECSSCLNVQCMVSVSMHTTL